VKNKSWLLISFFFLGGICLLLACSSKSNASKSSLPVTILLTQTAAYCGGAQPPEELLNALATPQPLAGEKMFIRSGNKNNPGETSIIEVVTGADGSASFFLNAGEYYVVFENKQDKTTYEEYKIKYGSGSGYYEPIDLKCLDEWLSKPELVFVVSDTMINPLTLNVYKPCSWNSIPCAQFTGSLPP
jgi:hypothetical protein